MAGYSGKPLAEKLGVREGAAIRALRAPRGYLGWLRPLPPGARIAKAGKPDLVHVFATRRAELATDLAKLRRTLDPAVPVWVSWPKKSTKLPTDVTEDTIRALALPIGYVDVKVCAVTDTWSGLKLVVRKALRGGSDA